jgi:hypothetical protein
LTPTKGSGPSSMATSGSSETTEPAAVGSNARMIESQAQAM